MNPRHTSRILVLKALYEADLTGHPPGTALSRHFTDGPVLPDEVRMFATELLSGVVKKADTLDARLGACAPNFPVQTLALIDRNVLRIALLELMEQQTPMKVIVNEAVELAKEFGSDVSSRFVNGVLAEAIVRYHQDYAVSDRDQASGQ